MANDRRKIRLQSLIAREIATYLLKDIQNPKVGFVSVIGVELNRDFSMAKVLISIFGSEDEQKKAFQAIKTTSSFIQYLLAKNLQMRKTPVIRFELSDSLKKGDEMADRLLNLD